jgi:cytochrome oxidase Cu insertion factor (SCO1/SenC/PrrC family)
MPIANCQLPIAFCLLTAVCLAGCTSSTPLAVLDDDYGTVGDFSLTERISQTIRQSDLLGKVWVAAFIFTRCAGPCAQISGSMARLQHDLAGLDGVVLVSFTVDPQYDQPQVLSAYATRYGADPKRWLFLTGEQDAVYSLNIKSFKLGVV